MPLSVFCHLVSSADDTKWQKTAIYIELTVPDTYVH